MPLGFSPKSLTTPFEITQPFAPVSQMALYRFGIGNVVPSCGLSASLIKQEVFNSRKRPCAVKVKDIGAIAMCQAKVTREWKV